MFKTSENHSSDHYKTWQLYCPSHGYYLIRFLRSSVCNCYFGKFSLKISDVFFQGQTLFGQISGMVGPIDVKRKGNWLVGYWVQYVTLTFHLTHDLDLGCFKVKFRNSYISGIVGLIDVKWKGSELIWYWVDCMTFAFDHTHDLDLGVSRSESEIIALSQEWGGRLRWNEKDWVIHSWPWYWLVWPWWGGRMYRIVTGVTSDVGVPSTYQVEHIEAETKWPRFSRQFQTHFRV